MEAAAPNIRFRLDPRTGIPPYLQLVRQVRLGVTLGTLRDGDQLPSVREVVTQITINPNTVHRAYRELEAEGLAVGRPGSGTFVVVPAASSVRDVDRSRLLADLRQWIHRARAVGIADGDLWAVVAEALETSDVET